MHRDSYLLCVIAVIGACTGGQRSSPRPAPPGVGDTTAVTGDIGQPADSEPATADTMTADTMTIDTAAVDSATSEVETPDTTIRDTSAAESERPDTVTPAAPDTAASPSPDSTASAADTAGGAGQTRVNEFMSYEAAGKTIALDVIAAYDNSLGGFNFNGGYNGNQTVTVPQGWTVTMHFVNKDFIPHSAVVIEDQKPLPSIPSKPAIPRAYTKELVAGLPTDATDTFPFTATTPGTYLLACGVPGHAASGMYIRFVVSADASAPSYKQ